MGELQEVLLVGRVNTVGGSARVVQMLHAGLIERGIGANVVFPEAARAAIEPWYNQARLDSDYQPGIARAADRTSFKRAKQFFCFLKERKFDLLNIHFSGLTFSALDVVPAALLCRKPVIVSLHTFSPEIRHTRKSLLNTRIASKIASRIVVLSDLQRALATKFGAPQSKTVVLPNGVDPVDLERRTSNRRFRKGARFVVGTMCRQEKDKRVLDIAEALTRSPTFMRLGRWVVAGAGDHREINESRSKDLLNGRVEFYGHIEDHATFYRSLNLYALVSDSEAFNLTYLEAAHFGVPSIGTAIGGAAQFVVPGKTGDLFQPGDIDGISGSVEAYASNPAMLRQASRAARTRVDTEFTSEQFVSRYVDVMREVAKV